ncbi:aldo/keto reductase [Sanguibacter antarcticus]|uniref:Aryl-alcohol dehydrogenase-like predicted oxidoreductase n=1 Tax=Sanguibacter antarcticus TaxID=372484 RepID=A0A2A9E2J1_9MICO|nr:aldo/keto reductase [Sanguibacter antarcticus]PFG33053.1 aryl-alcohol dehydrogenase-like predicted oxidoreductase [Sanguibacter antarcticus]
MVRISLGASGLVVPPLCIGTMYFGTQVPVQESHRILDRALERGYAFFDTANNYAFWAEGAVGDESEQTIGSWLRSRARGSVLVATKVGARPQPGSASLDSVLGLSRPAIREQVEGSLRRLQTDYVDVLYAHIDDSLTPLEETVSALLDEVARGTARRIACSNLSAERLSDAVDAVQGGPGYCAIQQRFTYLTPAEGADLTPHVLLSEDVMEVAERASMSRLGYSPLLGGAYSAPGRGVPDTYISENTERQLSALRDVASTYEVDSGQVVLAWMAQRSRPVVPVVGVSSVQQLESALVGAQTQLDTAALQHLEQQRGTQHA